MDIKMLKDKLLELSKEIKPLLHETDNLNKTHKKVEAVIPNNRYEKILVKVAGVKHH
ncbi:hypothetical protein [uncultured Acetatifactor sp.]|jgi:hypothetical protein|uniref:hypothetical protein n=1 Tax=uncultured Acetatifactor sp. TaxID=1671927 RepID=UPI0025E0C9F9|nr:hypothetical protein [uncultured Acetatifactor sp.]